MTDDERMTKFAFARMRFWSAAVLRRFRFDVQTTAEKRREDAYALPKLREKVYVILSCFVIRHSSFRP